MPYRNDEEAARSRRQELDAELVEAKKRAAEVGYLEHRVREIEAQISALSAQQEDLKKARLPLLSRARVASPCGAEWSDMVGDEHVRLCKSWSIRTRERRRTRSSKRVIRDQCHRLASSTSKRRAGVPRGVTSSA